MHRSTRPSLLLAVMRPAALLLATAVVALSGCTGTDIELTEPATAPNDMTSSQPSSPGSRSFHPSAKHTTQIMPVIDEQAPARYETATFALG